jgi:hypothetical protein
MEGSEMKRAFFSVLVVLTFSIPAQARSFYHHYGHKYHHLSHRYSHYLTQRHFRHHHYAHRRHHRQITRRLSLPGPCYTAAAMGGPCGCWTGKNTLGIFDHVWRGYNLWLAGDWLRFPQAIPVYGTAAAWKNRSHVAPVMHANGDVTVTVRDYWGVHKVRRDLVVIVDPHPPIKAGWRVTELWPL